MGGVIKFIPAPVIVGFTAGIGVIIWVGQWKYFFGLAPVEGSHFHDKLWHSMQALPYFHPGFAATGAIARWQDAHHMPGAGNYVDDFGHALAQCRTATELPGQALRTEKRQLLAAAQALIKTSKDFFLGDKK